MRRKLAKHLRYVLGPIAAMLLAAGPASAEPLYSVTDFGPSQLGFGSISPPPDILTANRVSIDDAGQVTVAPWGQPSESYSGLLPASMESNPGGFPRSAVAYAQAGGNVAGWGFETTPAQWWRAFAVVNGMPYAIGGPDSPSQAFGVNQSGQVVGWNSNGGFLFTPATGPKSFDFTPNGGPGAGVLPYAINVAGQIVGQYRPDITSSETHALLSDNGAHPIDLNNFIVPGSGFTLLSAMGINRHGQIAAFGKDAAGHVHALRLDPSTVPEPNSIALFGLVSAGLFLFRSSPCRHGRRSLEPSSAV